MRSCAPPCAIGLRSPSRFHCLSTASSAGSGQIAAMRPISCRRLSVLRSIGAGLVGGCLCSWKFSAPLGRATQASALCMKVRNSQKSSWPLSSSSTSRPSLRGFMPRGGGPGTPETRPRGVSDVRAGRPHRAGPTGSHRRRPPRRTKRRQPSCPQRRRLTALGRPRTDHLACRARHWTSVRRRLGLLEGDSRLSLGKRE